MDECELVQERDRIVSPWQDMRWQYNSAKRNVLAAITGTATMTWGRMGWLIIGLSFSAAACGSHRGRRLATGLADPVGSISAKCDVSANVRLKAVSVRCALTVHEGVDERDLHRDGRPNIVLRMTCVTRSRC